MRWKVILDAGSHENEVERTKFDFSDTNFLSILEKWSVLYFLAKQQPSAFYNPRRRTHSQVGIGVLYCINWDTVNLFVPGLFEQEQGKLGTELGRRVQPNSKDHNYHTQCAAPDPLILCQRKGWGKTVKAPHTWDSPAVPLRVKAALSDSRRNK